MSTTDQALLQQVQYVLIEPPDGGQSWPSGLWTRTEMLALANQRQDAFLYDTFLLVGIANVAVVAGTQEITLPSDWLRAVTVVWRGSDGTVKELEQSDSFEADHLLPTWDLTADTPVAYMEDDVTASGVLRLAPAPSVDGTIELLYVPAGTTLNGNGELLVVPDDFAQVVKYGILASALAKDGRGRDGARAQYCQQRVDLVQMATNLIIRGWA